jgi:hypothetical protein
MRHKKRRLTWGFANVLDNGVYDESHKASGIRPKNERNGHSKIPVITEILVVITSLLTNGQSSAYAALTTSQQISNYKLYAHNKIFDADQYECYTQLINRESHWNPKVHNNKGHYGMVQGESKWLSTVDAYQQIDWSINYIQHRYKSMCVALQHSKSKGWY